METTHYLNNEPVKIIQAGGRGEVLVETVSGRQVIVHKSGLAPRSTRPVSVAALRVDDPRKYAPAR